MSATESVFQSDPRAMTHRERFNAIMHYKPVDRCPIYDFSFWNETLPEWKGQGLPDCVTRRDSEEFFGMDVSIQGGSAPVQVTAMPLELSPAFEVKVIEDRGDTYVQQASDGKLELHHKHSVTIPQFLEHRLQDRESWEKDFKWRLDPGRPERQVPNLDEQIAKRNDPSWQYPVFAPGGSIFGRLRDWAGVEGIAMIVYDDPELFEEMVETMTVLVEENLKRLFAKGLKVDAIGGWEDMCFNTGPLLSPDHVKQYLIPRYRRIAELANKHGCDIYWTDCDGDVSTLVPMWLDAGLNTLFPLEIGNWADPVAYRKEYGKDLRMMGGFDKHVLAKSKEAIDREIDRLTPVVEEGGFIPFADHRVPPDVPLAHYLHYLMRVRETWGRGVNLPAMPALDLPV